jgi:hypothetical protein
LILARRVVELDELGEGGGVLRVLLELRLGVVDLVLERVAAVPAAATDVAEEAAAGAADAEEDQPAAHEHGETGVDHPDQVAAAGAAEIEEHRGSGA